MCGSEGLRRGRGLTVGGTPGEVSLLDLYRILLCTFGPQGWWPGKTPFEIAVGAILTQNTNWMNVERAIANLREEGMLSPRKMAGLSRGRLSSLIRPAGYYNVKADRLRHFLRYLDVSHGMRMKGLSDLPSARLREELLSVKGIGPETADSILLYAAGHPLFVIDAYTRRIFSRHGLIDEGVTYDRLQEFVVRRIPVDAALYNEFHALLVKLGKEYCRPRRPRCGECPLGPTLLPKRRRSGTGTCNLEMER
jgi:endonuclease-3 related protein